MRNQTNYVTKIRDNYTAHENDKLDELKALDKKVKTFPTAFAYVLGTIAALILGVGMCLAMQVIGVSVMSSAVLMTVGVIVGVIGIGVCVANYFVYKILINRNKKKYGDQIITLSNELLNK